MLLPTLIAVIIVSALSLLGAILLVVGQKTFRELITYSLAISSGVLLGSVFFDLLPEGVELLGDGSYGLVLVGFVSFFVLEKLLSWHHHIEGDHLPAGRQDHGDEKPVAYLTLLGDGIHNFADGVVIAGAFLAAFPTGIMTTIAVVAHEIPHELSDFLILLHGGLKPGKALFYNFLSATTAIAGALVVYLLATEITQLERFLVPLAAGNFLYIAATDLVPELLKKRQRVAAFLQIVCLIGGIAIIPFVRTILPHG